MKYLLYPASALCLTVGTLLIFQGDPISGTAAVIYGLAVAIYTRYRRPRKLSALQRFNRLIERADTIYHTATAIHEEMMRHHPAEDYWHDLKSQHDHLRRQMRATRRAAERMHNKL